MFNWFKKIPKVEEKTYDYTPSKDFYKSIREREEKVRYEIAKKAANSVLNQKHFSVGHLPGGTITGGSITSTNLADSAITINGGPNGSMKVDVPLIVNGRNVMKELDEMRDVLLLLRRDMVMEAKYPRLKELKDEYEAALAKYQTFEAIKESK